MDIPISKQVSATYARNHFKEVNDRAIKDGYCVIVRKSEPTTVVLSIDEYKKLYKRQRPKVKKKIDLEELRKSSIFEKHAGCMENDYPGLSSVQIAKKWTDYVD